MVFGKNILVAAVCMILLCHYVFARPQTSSSSGQGTTLTASSSTQTTSSENSTATTTAVTSAATTETTTEEFVEPAVITTTPATTTTTSLPPTVPAVVQVTKVSGENGTNGTSEDGSGNNTTGLIVGLCFGGIILFGLLTAAAVYFICRRIRTRNDNPAQGPTEIVCGNAAPAKVQSNGKKAKKEQAQTPPPPANEFEPHHIPAQKFKYLGPLVLQTQPPQDVPMVHELANERPPSIHESDHVLFDDAQNYVQEIGSEVEIFKDGEKILPKKARSSLPSPYAGGAAAKTGGPGGGKKKLSEKQEKQRDKAIRE